MSLQTSCPHCQKLFTLPDKLFGKRIKCKHCGGVFRVGGGEVEPASEDFDANAASAATQPGLQASPDHGGSQRQMPGAARMDGLNRTEIEGMGETALPPEPNYFSADTAADAPTDLTSGDTHTDAISSGDTVSDATPGAMNMGEPELTSGDTVNDAFAPLGGPTEPGNEPVPTADHAAETAAEIPADESESLGPKGKLAGKGKLPGKGKFPAKGKKETKSLDKKEAPLPGKGKLPAGRKAPVEATNSGKKKGSKAPLLLVLLILFLLADVALIMYVPQVRALVKLDQNDFVNEMAAKINAPNTKTKPTIDTAANPTPDQPKPEEPKPDQPKPDQPKPDQPKPEEPKPDQPKPDQPKPDKPKDDGYAETGYEHLRTCKPGLWAAMESKTVMPGTESVMFQRYTFLRVEGDEAVLIAENFTAATGRVGDATEMRLALKFKKTEGDAPKPETESKIEKGEETLTLGGKEYPCRWVQTTTTKDGVESVSKVWIAKNKISDPAIGLAGGGLGMLRIDFKSGDMTSRTELLASGTESDAFMLPGSTVEVPKPDSAKPDQPKPDEPKPDDEWVEVVTPGATWLRGCVKGDWILHENTSTVADAETKSYTRYVFDGLDGDDALIVGESIAVGQEPYAMPVQRISTVDKVTRVKKSGPTEAPKPAVSEENLNINGRDFLCDVTTFERDGTTSKTWTVKTKTDPRMIGLGLGGYAMLQSSSESAAFKSMMKTMAFGAAEDDYKKLLPAPAVEAPKPDEPKPDQPKPEDELVDLVTPSPYKHLRDLEPGDWLLMEEDIKGHMLEDKVYVLLKFKGLEGDIATVSVETVKYVTGRDAQTSKEDLQLNTADDLRKVKRSELPEKKEEPAPSEETLTINGKEFACFVVSLEGEEVTRVWTPKTRSDPRMIGLAGRQKLIGTGAVKIEVKAGEVRFLALVNKWGTALEAAEIPAGPKPTVEGPKPDEPKPDQPKPEDEFVEVNIPGAKWLADCKEGDWVIVENHTKGQGFEQKAWMRYVFIRLDGEDAILSAEMHMADGSSQPGVESRVRVTDRVERVKKADIKEPPKTETGDETLSLAGREFGCTWTKLTTEGGYLVQSWTVKDKSDPRMIGLAGGGWGGVKSTMHGESSGTDTVVTLIAFGTKEDDFNSKLPKPAVETPKPDEPKPDQPKPDEPKPDVEGPKPDEPKPDQPKPDEPKLPEARVEKPDQPAKLPENKWPAYEPKKPAEAKFGKPNDFFNEDLSNPRYDWGWLPAGTRLVKGTPDVNGAIEVDANSSFHLGASVSDCEVRLTIWRNMSDDDRNKTGSDSKGYEVHLRWTDASNYSALQIRADGYYRIIKVGGGKTTTLVGDSKGGYLPIPRWDKNADYDTLVVTVRKDFIGGTFNGHRLNTTSEAGSGTGSVGIRSTNGLALAIEKIDVNE